MKSTLQARLGWRCREDSEELLVWSAFHRLQFRLNGLSRQERGELLALLEGRSIFSLEDMSGKLSASVESLYEEGVFANVRGGNASLAKSNIFDRQIRFFERFSVKESGEEFCELIQDKRVLVVGLGGIGSHLVEQFARIGIRSIVGIDCDVVEGSNLTRQVLYCRSDIGEKKVFAAKRRIKEINPNVEFIGVDVMVTYARDIVPYMDNVDLVINGFGYAPLRELEKTLCGIILAACRAKKVPCFLFGGSAFGPIFDDGLLEYSSVFNIPEIQDLSVSQSNALRESFQASFSPRVAIVANIASWEAVRYLGNLPGVDLSRNVIILDTLSYQVRIAPLSA